MSYVEQLKNIRAEDLASSEYEVVDVNDTLSHALGVFKEKHPRVLIVYDGASGRYEGLLAERWIVRSMLDPSTAKVKAVYRRAPKLKPEDTLPRIARLMVENDLRHLPVFSGEKLLGIVADEHVLEAAARTRFGSLPVSEFMTKNPITVRETDSIAKALAVMRREGIARLPVVRGDKPVGIVTMHDIVHEMIKPRSRARLGEVAGEKIRPFKDPVTGIMTRSLLTAKPDDPVSKAVKTMLSNDVSSLIVVDDQGRLRGLLTRTDLLKPLGALDIPEPRIMVQLSVKDPEEFENIEIDREKITAMMESFARKYSSFLGSASVTVFVKRHKEKRRGRRLTHCRIQVLSPKGLFVGIGEGWGLNQAVRAALDNVSRHIERAKEEEREVDKTVLEEVLGLV